MYSSFIKKLQPPKGFQLSIKLYYIQFYLNI